MNSDDRIITNETLTFNKVDNEQLFDLIFKDKKEQKDQFETYIKDMSGTIKRVGIMEKIGIYKRKKKGKRYIITIPKIKNILCFKLVDIRGNNDK